MLDTSADTVFDNWYVYIVRCADKTLYTGITKDIEQRLDEHLFCALWVLGLDRSNTD